MSYVHRNPDSGVYRFRRAVPGPLRPILGRREYIRSLGTTDPREAKRRAAEVAREVQQELDAAAAGLSAEVVVPPTAQAAPEPGTETAPRRLTLFEAQAIARSYRDKGVEEQLRAHAGSDKPRPRHKINQAIEFHLEARDAIRSGLQEGHLSALGDLATTLLGQQGHEHPSDADIRLLLPLLARALIEFNEIQLRLLAGEWPLLGTSGAPPAAANPVVPATAPAGQMPVRPGDDVEERQPDINLKQLADRYVAHAKPSQKTRDELFRCVTQFGEVNGADRRVRGIGKPSITRFHSILSQKPSAMRAEERELPLDVLVGRYEGRDVQRLSAGTVEKCLRLLSAMLAFGHRHGYVEKNPFVGMVSVSAEGDSVKRRAFKAGELERLFTSPIYRGCAGPKRRFTPGPHVIRDGLYWIPLLANYLGARLEELGQALVSDVVDEDGVLVLAIQTIDEHEQKRGRTPPKSKEDGGKKVKNDESIRRVPIHPVILAAGFADYVADLRSGGTIRLFPELRPNKYGVLTAKISKDFAKLLASLGLDDPALVFHSLRHGFKTISRSAHMEEEVHDYLTGHAHGSVGRSYGHYDIELLFEEISRITFPTVDKLFLA